MRPLANFRTAREFRPRVFGGTEDGGISLIFRQLDTTETIMSTAVIPDTFLDLFTKKAFAHLATLMPSGDPQVTPVWIDYDGEQVIFNTAVGRQKDKNLQRDGRVSLSITDPDNPYRYLEVRGRVSERTMSGADSHIDKMAKKYLDKDKYPFRQPGEVRVIFKVTPERITSMG
jgi:PPOX class probable F420-dependent enzyme